jgi:octanoyl-[GcvH]:protein N-octanoyltransferase
MPDALEIRSEHGEHVEPSVSMKGRWQAVCVPAVYSVEIGLARQQTLADELTSQFATPTLMVWRCKPALLVTRSETRLPHFDGAAAEMQAAGWPVLLRKSGGGACPVGSGTVQVSMIEVAFSGATMKAKYAVLSKLIQSTLCFFQIVSRIGSVAGAYCSGSYDLAVKGKKIAGMSQHWFRNRCGIHCVVTAASINIEEPPDVLAGVVNRFYDCAGSPLRCQAAALTNMRLCDGMAHLAGWNLASAVMTQLASGALTLRSRQ